MITKSALGSVALILLLISIVVSVNTAHSQGDLRYIVIVITPGLSLNGVNNATSVLGINTTTLQLLLDGPENPDYYVHWLVLGKKPESTNVLLLEPPGYDLMNNYTERISKVWSSAVIVDIPLVNPELNISAINTWYNLTSNSLEPKILEVEVNSTVFWEQLRTSISVELRDVELEIRIEEFNISFIVNNITLSKTTAFKAVNITGVESIADGVYYIGFYVLEVSNESVKLLFPGSLRTTGFMSSNIKPIEARLVPWTLVYQYRDFFSNLPDEAREWIVNLTISTTQNLITRAISDTSAGVYIVYAPHIRVAELLNVTGSVEVILAENIISPFATNRVRPGFLLVIFNPKEGFAVHYGNYAVLSDLELTVSQYTSILLSFSDLSPIQSVVMLKELSDLRDRVRELEQNISDLSEKVNDLNNTLQETRNNLHRCESSRDYLESRLMNIDKELQHAEELRRSAYLYITTGLLITVAIGILLGFFTTRTCKLVSSRLKRA